MIPSGYISSSGKTLEQGSFRGESVVSIAYCIPAYNAGARLDQVLTALSEHQRDLVMVDDGSTDETGQIARTAGVQVLAHAQNRGKGAALRTGFAYLSERGYDWIVTLDADGQHDPGDIPKLLATARAADEQGLDWGLIIGSRFASKELIPAYRYYPNRVGQLFLQWLTGQPIEDTQSGFRVYRTELLRKVELTSERFALETEVILKIARLGNRILFAPITTIYGEDERRTTNFRPVLDTYRIALVVLKEIWTRLSSSKSALGRGVE
jgi:glycosyltransferase involved in cell wall biosynthesis